MCLVSDGTSITEIPHCLSHAMEGLSVIEGLRVTFDVPLRVWDERRNLLRFLLLLLPMKLSSSL